MSKAHAPISIGATELHVIQGLMGVVEMLMNQQP